MRLYPSHAFFRSSIPSLSLSISLIYFLSVIALPPFANCLCLCIHDDYLKKCLHFFLFVVFFSSRYVYFTSPTVSISVRNDTWVCDSDINAYVQRVRCYCFLSFSSFFGAFVVAGAAAAHVYCCCIISFITWCAQNVSERCVFVSVVHYEKCIYVVWFPDLKRIGHNRKREEHPHIHTHTHSYIPIRFDHNVFYAFYTFIAVRDFFLCISFLLLLLLCSCYYYYCRKSVRSTGHLYACMYIRLNILFSALCTIYFRDMHI